MSVNTIEYYEMRLSELSKRVTNLAQELSPQDILALDLQLMQISLLLQIVQQLLEDNSVKKN